VTQIVEGPEPGAVGSILQLVGQEEVRRLYELAVDVRGAGGLTSDSSGRGYLGARAATIGGGTSEIHRNKIAERVLGMPRDPWADS
jgi:alkylation response protein AidB-like acyl-CoA dehydrogenase